MLKPEFVAEAFGGVQVINDSQKLKEAIRRNMKEKNILLLMSSGNFDGMDILDF